VIDHKMVAKLREAIPEPFVDSAPTTRKVERGGTVLNVESA
jgi:hypothetical protein